MLGRDGRALITRQAVGRRLRVSYSTVCRWQEDGVLPVAKGPDGAPRQTPDGAYLFDLVDVERLELEVKSAPRARSVEGELWARAVQLFAAGKRVADVVVELREPWDVVESMLERYARGSYRLVPERVAARVERTLLDELGEPCEWDEGFADLVSRIASHTRRCEELASRATGTHVVREHDPPQRRSARGRRGSR